MFCLGLVLALVVGQGPGPSPAPDSAPPTVEWVAPAGCPSQAELTTAVERQVGRPLEREQVRAKGRVEATASGFVLDLEMMGAHGQTETRRLEDADCGVLSGVAALMIAVAIDPTAALEQPPVLVVAEPEPEPEPTEPEPPQPEPEPTKPEPAQPEPAPEPESTDVRPATSAPRSCAPGRPRWRDDKGSFAPLCVGMQARFGIQWGPLPRLGIGVGGDVSLLWPRLRLAAGGTFFPARPARLDDQPSLGGDVRLAVGHVRGCARLGRGPWELPLCAGAEAGVLHGQGVGIDEPRRDRLPWLAAVGDVGLSWSPVRRFALRTQLGAVVPIIRHSFGVGGLGTVHEPAAAGLRAAVAAELRLP
ncbi:MAG: hypothetical protein K0V04_10875 [Deltaproteobacteria bacterium]|nr:hypothetical protein [Deltaproteobacteria bacterium]